MSVDQDGLFEETTWPPFLDLPSWRRSTCAEPQVGPPLRTFPLPPCGWRLVKTAGVRLPDGRLIDDVLAG